MTNRFFGVPAVDLKHYPINAHFSEAADFIDSVIKGKGSYHSASSELSPINRYISNVVKFVTFQQSFLHFNVENAFTQHFGYIEM